MNVKFETLINSAHLTDYSVAGRDEPLFSAGRIGRFHWRHLVWGLKRDTHHSLSWECIPCFLTCKTGDFCRL